MPLFLEVELAGDREGMAGPRIAPVTRWMEAGPGCGRRVSPVLLASRFPRQ